MNHYFTNNDNLKSNIYKIIVDIHGIKYYFYTDNGVFSKNKLDMGTEILLKTIYPYLEKNKNVLDIGSGCGAIGIFLSKAGFNVTMSDINKRALSLVKKTCEEENIKVNVIESFCYENINQKYDYIVSNPPIRAGKKVLYDIVSNAKNYLNINGKLYIVIRKDKGAESLIKDMKNNYDKIEILEKKKGYFIISFEK